MDSTSQLGSEHNSDPNWGSIREEFPVFQHKTYINSCSHGALSVEVADATQQYLRDRQEKGSDWAGWVERYESVRLGFSKLLGATPDEIAITTSASASINAIASALYFESARNKVVMSDFEFPTSGQIWHAQELRGARVIRVPERDGYIPVEHFEAAIDEETLIVAVSEVCYRNGARLDIPAIAEVAKKKGALLLVDCYQCIGTRTFDVRESRVDFAVGGTLKYLLGSAGLGFLYVRDALIEDLVPTSTGWFAQADVFAMDHTRYDPSPTARRFEMGTPPVPNCYSAEAGLAMIARIGLPSIERRVIELTDLIKADAKKAGFTLAVPESTEQHGPMITLRTHDEHEVVARLEKKNIVTSCRDGNLRISPHFYNNENDIEVLFSELRELKHLFV